MTPLTNMTQLNFESVFRSLVLAAITFGVASLAASSTTAQTTADHLYRSVLKLQASLNQGEDGDAVRDTYMIRDLEFESGLGFSGNVGTLQQASSQFAAAQNLSAELEAVQEALDTHLQQIYDAGSANVQNDIAGLESGMSDVDVNIIDEARTAAIKSIAAVEKFNEDELSIYGAHYLNKRLRIKSLTKELEEFEIPEELDDKDKSNAFNRSLVGFRQTVGNARRTYGLASTEYHNAVLVNAEHKLKMLEERSFAYLTSQSTRARESFEEQLAQRKQVFVSSDGILGDSNSRLYQAELGRWISLLQQRNQSSGIGSAARQQFSKPNLRITVQESLVNRLSSRTISEMEHLDEVVVGSRAQGWTYTSGLVSLDFLNSPSSAHVRIGTSGNIQSSAYSKEGPVTAYTQSYGSFQASRDILANIGNVSVFEPIGNANVWSEFLGTSCQSRLINRIAVDRFNERTNRANEIASERATERLIAQFTEETDKALFDGLGQLDELKSREGEFRKTLDESRGEISTTLARERRRHD